MSDVEGGPPPLPDGAPPAPGPAPGRATPPPPAPGPAGDTGDDEAAAQRAMLHRTEQTRTYPCGACGGQLEFNIEHQLLVCPHCGNRQEIIEDAGREVVEQDFHAAVAELRASVARHREPQLSGELEVVCQSCGGHTTFTGTLTSTRCPYCATPIQRDDVHDAPARLPVDGLLPFRVDEETARTAIEKWVNGRWFAPNEFKKYKRTGAFTSVYMSYFTYDATTTTDYTGRRGDNYTVTVGEGENRRTETRTRWSHRSGRVHDSFDDIAVFANTGLDAGHVRKLEPWPTQQALPYSAEYVAGHLCRTYDHDVEQCFGEARERMQAEIRTTVRRDIGGDKQQITSMETRYDSLGFKHLLLPIWLLTVIFEQKPFQVMINGVTGEVQGQRPYSALKIALAVLVALVVVGVGLAIYASSGGGGR